MQNNSRAVVAAIAGAALGSAVGYLFFTEHGRRFRGELEPTLKHMSRELDQLRGTLREAATVASRGWQLLNDALGSRTSVLPHPPAHQTSPF